MSEIEWTDKTWNPIKGCFKVSPGCKNCYAIRMAERLQAMQHPLYVGTVKRNGKANWTGKIGLSEKLLTEPLRWKKPSKIFVNSMSDMFYESVPFEFIKRAFDTMLQADWHEFQILTKRPERAYAFFEQYGLQLPQHIWLGVSVESNAYINRLDMLRQLPATIRFVSFEPLLDSVSEANLKNIDWAIVGGESGPDARAMKEEWIDEIYDACQKSDTAFFFKQWGNWGKDNKRRSKKENGREYQNQIWDEMPAYG
ncbi:MAG: phage Gp37/Gp68 family protein [Alphaproteobacteria bacterium]|nr:phage Gp37/Gp68 family protein [Alphaproteobacteria bacterium]